MLAWCLYVTDTVCVSIRLSDLFILYLQGRQAGLELGETEGELSLDLRLGGNLGHLTGSGGRTDFGVFYFDKRNSYFENVSFLKGLFGLQNSVRALKFS